ncbi:DUF2267 domain-containing protein [Halomarina oriensis]|uniref:DUF2267 domain-containing protein n=1 Tax=Halomarina oriensis TaxID=671145 RepID=A0A6B0GEU0_9EURY|nr:DUF2267 domain-containing protein [Halomarina oriensis]
MSCGDRHRCRRRRVPAAHEKAVGPRNYRPFAGVTQETDLLQHVQRCGGHDTVDAARESTHAVLRSLGATLPDEEAEALAAQLPEAFETDLTNAETADDRSPEAFSNRIDGSSDGPRPGGGGDGGALVGRRGCHGRGDFGRPRQSARGLRGVRGPTTRPRRLNADRPPASVGTVHGPSNSTVPSRP